MKRGFLNNTRKRTGKPDSYSTGGDNSVKHADDAIFHDLQIFAFDTQYTLEGPVCTARTHALPSPRTGTMHPKSLISTRAPLTSIDKFGSTSCVLYNRTLVQLLQTPKYRSPLNSFDSTSPFPYAIRDFQSKGKAMFATRTLKPGDLILVERALVVVPINTDLSTIAGCPEVFRTEMTKFKGTKGTLAGILEPILEVALSRMSEEDQRSYLGLYNAHREDGTPRLSAIWRTNVFLFNEVDGDGDQYGAVIKVMSRINHSCRPNCAKSFDEASFSFELRATKTIAAGEEILYAYCSGMDLPTSERQAQLSPYGFSCTCLSCLAPTSNDALRTSILPRLTNLKTRSLPFMGMDTSKLDRTATLAMHEEGKSLLRDLREEGLDGCRWYRDALNVQLALTVTLGRLVIGILYGTAYMDGER